MGSNAKALVYYVLIADDRFNMRLMSRRKQSEEKDLDTLRKQVVLGNFSSSVALEWKMVEVFVCLPWQQLLLASWQGLLECAFADPWHPCHPAGDTCISTFLIIQIW